MEKGKRWSYPDLRMGIARARITALFLDEYGVANRLDDMLEEIRQGERRG